MGSGGVDVAAAVDGGFLTVVPYTVSMGFPKSLRSEEIWAYSGRGGRCW